MAVRPLRSRRRRGGSSNALPLALLLARGAVALRPPAAAVGGAFAVDLPTDSAAAPTYEEWLGLAPEPESDDHADRARAGRPGEDDPTDDADLIACPPFAVDRPAAPLRRLLEEGAPVLPRRVPACGHGCEQETVFLIAHPFTGSTALLGLLATSPQASTLCAQGFWACEGQWLLFREGLGDHSRRWDPRLPGDWGEAWLALSRYWNTSRPVLLEKSPPNAVKIPEIANGMRRLGRRASFIVMTASPCGQRGAYDPSRFDKFVSDLAQLERGGAGSVRMLRFKYEELLDNPWEVSQRIVDFLPQLGFVNPADTARELEALGEQSHIDMHGRDKSVGAYVVSLGDSKPYRKRRVGGAWRGYMEVGGYARRRGGERRDPH